MWLGMRYLGNLMTEDWGIGLDEEEAELVRVTASQYPIWERLYDSWWDRRTELADELPWYDNLY